MGWTGWQHTTDHKDNFLVCLLIYLDKWWWWREGPEKPVKAILSITSEKYTCSQDKSLSFSVGWIWGSTVYHTEKMQISKALRLWMEEEKKIQSKNISSDNFKPSSLVTERFFTAFNLDMRSQTHLFNYVIQFVGQGTVFQCFFGLWFTQSYSKKSLCLASHDFRVIGHRVL